MSVIQIWVFCVFHSCLNMGLARNNMSESSVCVIRLIDILWITLFLFFFQNTSLSSSVASLIVIIEIMDGVFLLLFNLDNLVWQMFNCRRLNNIFIINKKFNVINSLPSLSVSRAASSWLINANYGSFLIWNQNDLIIMGEFSWVL